ncbi:hypothetical protein [Phocaeicola salanitronis]|uniref:hypothetical protein n=1 Tax=Phocaeicola salanitronis TaxID=376805 RepID=UPI00320924A3
MKTKQVSLAILASMTLFACSNNEDVNVPITDNTPKTVVLKLDGIASASSRSTDAPTTEESSGTNKHSVSVSDIAVIFYNEGGIITEAPDIITTDDADGDWATITSEQGNGKEYNNIDAATDHVMVIGNYNSLPETNKNLIKQGTTIASIKAMQLPLSSQNQSGVEEGSAPAVSSTKAKMTLYGTGELTEIANPDATTDGVAVAYQATVSIKPIVSRIEVTGVSCTFTTTGTGDVVDYTNVTLKGIGLFDYYNTMSLDGTTVTDYMDATKIVKPSEEAPEGGYIFLPTIETALWAYDYIKTPDYTNVTMQGSGKVELKKGEANATFAYNFFPVTDDVTSATDADKVLANIRLLVDATPASGTAQNNNYVVTTNFRNEAGTVIKPEPGKIYQFAYDFDEENIRQEWDADTKIVYVKVNVLEWDIVPVTPSF